MRLYNLLKSVFGRSLQRQPLAPIDAPLIDTASSPQSYSSPELDTEIANRLTEIEKEATFLNKNYGSDFNTFLYRLDAADFICKEVVQSRYPDNRFNHFLDHSHWADIHYLNFPGPFYTGESDTCDTGPYEAPNNVLRDANAMEYVFRQPQSFAEFLCVVDAAAVEVFDSYSCDGNQYWTYQLCREWWRSKPEIIRPLSTPAFRKYNGKRIQLYIDYLNKAAETDLRKYCYFLENGEYPSEGQPLPPL